MKFNKKIIMMMTIVSILSVGCSRGNDNNKEQDENSKKQSIEQPIDETTMSDIENNIPYIANENGEIDYLNIDNNIIDKRYENVNKEELAYSPIKYKDEQGNTIEETEDIESTTKIFLADSIKNDTSYKSILQGFTYLSEVNPTSVSYYDALELVSKVLPDDIEKVNIVLDEETNKEYIYYKSEKGNFRVGLCYGYRFNDSNEQEVDKNLIVGIDYSREI